jgi:hypothetical protein
MRVDHASRLRLGASAALRRGMAKGDYSFASVRGDSLSVTLVTLPLSRCVKSG